MSKGWHNFRPDSDPKKVIVGVASIFGILTYVAWNWKDFSDDEKEAYSVLIPAAFIITLLCIYYDLIPRIDDKKELQPSTEKIDVDVEKVDERENGKNV